MAIRLFDKIYWSHRQSSATFNEAESYFRSSFFWDVMSCQWVVGVRTFERMYWSHLEVRIST